MMQPSILFLDHSGQIGGAELSLLDLLSRIPIPNRVILLSDGPLRERLRQHGIGVEIINVGGDLLSTGIETPLLRRFRGLYRVPLWLRKLVHSARQCDLVYVNSKKALLFGTLAARLTGKPLIWHQRDAMQHPAALSLRGRLSEGLLLWLLNRYVSRVISVSKACVQAFVEAGGRSDLPIVIYNGLDPMCYAAKVDRDAVRLSSGLPLQTPLIGCFGRLTAWKGQSVLIEALTQLPEAHAALVGGAIFGEVGYVAALHAQVERLGLVNRVHFLGHRDDVPALMQAVDVVAHPSTEFEPFGRVIIEGMLSKRPVVATAVGGVPELVQDNETGLLVPPADPVALAAALRRIIEDPGLGLRLAAEGHRQALERFTLDRVVKSVTTEIRTAIGTMGKWEPFLIS